MSLPEERICYLLHAYTYRTATAAEEEELFQWVSETSDDTLLKDHIQQLVQVHAGEKFPEVDWENIYREVLQKASKNMPRLTRRRRVSWYRVAAAILALMIGGSGIYLSLNKKKPSLVIVASVVQSFKNDVGPGSAKAILQAGNTQVMLNKKDTSFILAGNTVHINGGNVQIADVKPINYTLITPHGGEYKLVLADGTRVWLNAASRLVYPSLFTGNTREVMLEGEAYFEVYPDAGHPFIVNTAGQSIKVLGTEFNVQAYSNEDNIVTTLVQGKVQVNSLNKSLQLQPGQQTLLNAAGELHLNSGIDIEQVIAWKNGYFRFDKADIHSIMRQLSRWYDVDVEYEKGLLPHYFGALISRDNNMSQVLNMLEATGDVHFKIEGKQVTVMP